MFIGFLNRFFIYWTLVYYVISLNLNFVGNFQLSWKFLRYFGLRNSSKGLKYPIETLCQFSIPVCLGSWYSVISFEDINSTLNNALFMDIGYDWVQETNAWCPSVGIKSDLCRYTVIYVFDLFRVHVSIFRNIGTKAIAIMNTVCSSKIGI